VGPRAGLGVRRRSRPPPGFDPRTVQPVASRYKNSAIPAPVFVQWRTQEFSSGGFNKYSVEDRGQRERGSGGSSPLVRSSGGSCNLVQEISFHIVKFS